MTVDEFIEECDLMKQQIIDIIRTYYHNYETIEDNMRKFNTFFSIPISQEDVEYIINTKVPELFNIKSVNSYIEKTIRKKYNKQYINPVYSTDEKLCDKSREYYKPKTKRRIYNPDSITDRKRKFSFRYRLSYEDIDLIRSYDGTTSKRKAYLKLVKEKNVKFSYVTYITYLNNKS